MVMKDIFKDNENVMEILNNNPRIIKTIEDDEPNEIGVYCYGSILITPFGVAYKPKHGYSTNILKFDKYFNYEWKKNV